MNDLLTHPEFVMLKVIHKVSLKNIEKRLGWCIFQCLLKAFYVVHHSELMS